MKTKYSPSLDQAMQYAEMMEACASYVAVKSPVIKEPSAVCRLMSPLVMDSKQEHIYALLLDVRSKLIGAPHEIFRGLIDSCPMHPREIFKMAVTESASALIIVHNHPSGDPTPSREDIEATRRLVEAGRIVGIPVFDHVIVADATYISLREQNLVSFTSTLKGF